MSVGDVSQATRTDAQNGLADLLISIGAFGAAVMAVEKFRVGEAEAKKVGGYAIAVEAAVKDASNCERAYNTLAVCQLRSPADNALGDIVQGEMRIIVHGQGQPPHEQGVGSGTGPLLQDRGEKRRDDVSRLRPRLPSPTCAGTWPAIFG